MKISKMIQPEIHRVDKVCDKHGKMIDVNYIFQLTWQQKLFIDKVIAKFKNDKSLKPNILQYLPELRTIKRTNTYTEKQQLIMNGIRTWFIETYKSKK